MDPAELFTKLDHIGRGLFGEVYKGTDNYTKALLAIKFINLEEAKDETEDIHQEITSVTGAELSGRVLT